MTFDELLNIESNAPIRCADGAFGLLIRWYQDTQSAGVQVYGEETIRDIPATRLFDRGGGSLYEIAS